MTALDTATLEALDADFIGELVRPGDPTYDDTQGLERPHRPAPRAHRPVPGCRRRHRRRPVRRGEQICSPPAAGARRRRYALCDDGIVIDLQS
jgi:hypothetical protein